MLELNESKACDAIIRHLEAKTGSTRADVQTRGRHPETTKRVELTFRLGTELVAVEHTGIEPFSGFMQMNAEAARHFDPIRQAAMNTVPANSMVELHIPVNAFQGRPLKEIRQMQSALAHFIADAAAKLPMRKSYEYIGDIGPTNVPGVPFPVTLYRFESLGIGPSVQIVHRASRATEARTDRLREACEKKFPKLARWKADDNARTVLVLEDNDIQLTNPTNVAEAFLQIARSRNDVPDETYLISTVITDRWYLRPMLIGNESYFDLAQRDDLTYSEIDPTVLCAVTER
jgi:hypothetical protein